MRAALAAAALLVPAGASAASSAAEEVDQCVAQTQAVIRQLDDASGYLNALRALYQTSPRPLNPAEAALRERRKEGVALLLKELEEQKRRCWEIVRRERVITRKLRDGQHPGGLRLSDTPLVAALFRLQAQQNRLEDAAASARSTLAQEAAAYQAAAGARAAARRRRVVLISAVVFLCAAAVAAAILSRKRPASRIPRTL